MVNIPFRGLITLDIVTYELRTTKVSKKILSKLKISYIVNDKFKMLYLI